MDSRFVLQALNLALSIKLHVPSLELKLQRELAMASGPVNAGFCLGAKYRYCSQETSTLFSSLCYFLIQTQMAMGQKKTSGPGDRRFVHFSFDP